MTDENLRSEDLTSSGTIASGPRKLESSAQNLVWKPDSKLIDGLFVPPNDPRKLNKLIRKQQKDTTGSNWFDILAPTITPEIKKDLQILKFLLIKKHFAAEECSRSKEALHTLSFLCCFALYFSIALINSWVILLFNQVGTVIESASDFFSGRLTKKERKETLANELLADHSLTKYR
ncbi:hypothetical protein IFM89_034762 [Coptis chinensis]|uniref:Fcf2 pre-rRNA processing C-terminal domain-containing protein n=1 Tax=Coptis chinensis TaxID=261450 RepID=A0A835H8J8_9MAGN|nr:hypothetical protein IFM89_034762 [Coptis chinensis]